MFVILKPQNVLGNSTENRRDGEADDDPHSQKCGYPHGYPHPDRHRLQCIGNHLEKL